MWNYVYLNAGLTVNFNGSKYFSKNGLLDLLERKTNLEDTHRIYNMIKQDEDMEQANKQWWAYVQQLENK